MRQAILFHVLAILFISACGKKEDNKTAPVKAPKTIVSTKEIHLEGSPIRLPVGTMVTPSADGYELKVELPEGYSFLTSEFSTGNQEMQKAKPVFIVATYKCACSADNACQVFYQEEIGGFGCLHKSCSGSCTGSFTSLTRDIIGVMNMSNGEVSARKDVTYNKASLSSKGWEVFFDNQDVQEKIIEQYEMLYKNLPKPDFAGIKTDNRIRKNYEYVRVSLYGVPFYMILPKTGAENSRMVEAINAESAFCKCGNSSGNCKKKSKGILGWDAYWCEGDCNGCELTIDKGKKISD